MLTHYLDSVRYKNYFGLVGTIYIVPDARNRDQNRLVSTRVNGRTFKIRIFNDLRKHGEHENIVEWEWQPVVEGSHLESLDFNNSLSLSAENEFPHVLIRGKEEHAMNTRVFRTANAKELFGNDYTYGNSQRKQSAKEEALSNPNWRKVFMERAAKLAQMYETAYAGDPILQQIARNVFWEVKRRIVGGALGTR